MTVEAKVECLKLALALAPHEMLEARAESVVKIATRLYAFVVDDGNSSSVEPKTSPDRTLHLRGKK